MKRMLAGLAEKFKKGFKLFFNFFYILSLFILIIIVMIFEKEKDQSWY